MKNEIKSYKHMRGVFTAFCAMCIMALAVVAAMFGGGMRARAASSGDSHFTGPTAKTEAESCVQQKVLSGYIFEKFVGPWNVPIFCGDTQIGTAKYENPQFYKNDGVTNARGYLLSVSTTQYMSDGYENFQLYSGNTLLSNQPGSVEGSWRATYDDGSGNGVCWAFLTGELQNMTGYKIVCEKPERLTKYDAVNGVYPEGISAADLTNQTDVTSTFAPYVVIKNNVTNETATAERVGLKAYKDANDIVRLFVSKVSPWSFAGRTFSDITFKWEPIPDSDTNVVVSPPRRVTDDLIGGLWLGREDDLMGRTTITYMHTLPIVPLPEEPTKKGHHFVGWYYDAALTQAYDGQPIYADTTLYPKFEANRYIVKFVTLYGDPIEDFEMQYGGGYDLPQPTCEGYNFLGWFLEDGTECVAPFFTEKDVTLYAKWEIKTFDVTFMNSDGTVYKTINVPYGTKLGQAMETAQVASYGVKDMAGARVSKQSVITENEQVLVYELTRTEKIGDYIGTHKWVLWTTVGVVAGLILVAGISIAVAVKRR